MGKTGENVVTMTINDNTRIDHEKGLRFTYTFPKPGMTMLEKRATRKEMRGFLFMSFSFEIGRG